MSGPHRGGSQAGPREHDTLLPAGHLVEMKKRFESYFDDPKKVKEPSKIRTIGDTANERE